MGQMYGLLVNISAKMKNNFVKVRRRLEDYTLELLYTLRLAQVWLC